MIKVIVNKQTSEVGIWDEDTGKCLTSSIDGGNYIQYTEHYCVNHDTTRTLKVKCYDAGKHITFELPYTKCIVKIIE